MLRYRYWVAGLFLGACIGTASAKDLKIENFKSGLDCPRKPPFIKKGNDKGAICFETETIYLTGQGTCVFAGEPMQCDWYGFQFDYENATAGDEITCESSSNSFDIIGNPEGVTDTGSSKSTYSFPLESESGHFYNPQYSVFSYAGKNGKTVTHRTTCSFGTRELFKFKFDFIYPAAQ